MGTVHEFPTGTRNRKDKDIEDRRLARERIAAVAYEEARRFCSDPRGEGAFRDDADFEAAVSGVAKRLLEHTLAIVDSESQSRHRHAMRGSVPLPCEGFDARNAEYAERQRMKKSC